MEKQSLETESMVATLKGSGPPGWGVVVDNNSSEAFELSKGKRRKACCFF